MSFKINTNILKDLVNKADKGSSRQSTLAVSMCVNLEKLGRDLILTTTDNVSTLKVIGKNIFEEDEEDFFVCVDSELFTKLIGKQTVSEVELLFEKDYLQVNGNGSYKLPMVLDESGEVVRIPIKEFDANTNSKEISKLTINDLLTYNRVNIAKLVGSTYCGYYVDSENIITFDGINATVTQASIVEVGQELLLSASLVDLLNIVGGTINLQVRDNLVRLYSDEIEIISALKLGADRYPADAFKGLANYEYSSLGVFNRKDLIDAIERITLFLGITDRNVVRLQFSAGGLELISINEASIECIPYENEGEHLEFNHGIDVVDLKNQLKASSEKNVNIYYGGKDCLCIKNDRVSQLVPLVRLRD